MFRFKHFDLITTLLLVFLLFIPLIVLVVVDINRNIQDFSIQSETITKLKLLDKDFNNFIEQEGSFSNYDLINDKMAQFEKELLFLKERLSHTQNKEKYLQKLFQIQRDYRKKSQLIEHSKSYNSIIINSLNYLHDLQKNLSLRSTLSEQERDLLDDTIFMTIQLYVHIQQNEKELADSLIKIKRLSREKGDKFLSYFYQHEHSILEKIRLLHQERSSVKKLHIFGKLECLQQDLERDFQSYLLLGKVIMIAILLFITSLLLSILYLHRNALRQKKELAAYKYAIENSDNSIIITDINKNIIYANDAFEKETGYRKEEVMGENPRILQSGLMDKSYYSSLNSALDNYERWEGEFVNKRKDGSIFYEKASISPLRIDGRVTGYLAVKLNITKYIEQEKRVKFLAYHDPLTALPNRVQFENYFRQEIIEKQIECALLYIDLDQFKTINDTLGHHTGDLLLKVFSQRLKRVAKDAFVAKIGGDEFVVVVPIKQEEEAKEMAQKVLNSLQNPIAVDGHKLNISASIGIAIFPKDGSTRDAILKYADTAMYKAKARGRNTYQFFTPVLFKEILDRLEMEQELRLALQREELYVVYQPKYDLASKKIVGFEALIRWENQKLGLVSPDRFIAIAEDLGLIEEIGSFVFQKACRDFKSFQEIDPLLEHIAINVSTLQFREKKFLEKIRTISENEVLESTCIEIEITESCVMESIENNIKTMQRLRSWGYKIAIDDFGTGYSSFSYLKRLPATTLKIDKSFVDDIALMQRDKDIAGAIVALAQNLGFKTVAEGIENRAQEKILLEMGCVLGQGYLFSRPLPKREVEALLYKQRNKRASMH